jgi:predicted Zn-dependent protease
MRGTLRRAAAAVALIALVGCETAPITGRARLSPMDDEKLLIQGAGLYVQEVSRNPPARDQRTVEMVDRVGRRIAHAAENPPDNLWPAPNFQWEFSVVDKPGTINAVCLPGGKIIVYSGILPVAMDEDGLAVIMGHEVAHAMMRHHGERLSNRTAIAVGATVVGAVVGALIGGRTNTGQAAGALVGSGLAMAGSVLLMSFSRTQESEADRVGMILAAHAGYNPRAAVGFWERMQAASANRPRPPEFLSTHPTAATRIADIEKHMPEALKYFKANSQ